MAGWSGGGQYESSSEKALQQRGISGEIQDRKSSSQGRRWGTLCRSARACAQPLPPAQHMRLHQLKPSCISEKILQISAAPSSAGS